MQVIRQHHTTGTLTHQLTGIGTDQAGTGHIHRRCQGGIRVGQSGLDQNPAHTTGRTDNAYFHATSLEMAPWQALFEHHHGKTIEGR